MKLIAKQAFSWAHQGVRVEHFEDGQEIETEDADLIAVSTAEGWAGAESDKPRSTKAQKAALENKSAD